VTIKGYPSQKKYGTAAVEYATVTPVREQQNALDVISHLYCENMGSDAAETGSTTTSIAATAHAARRGDVIRFTSGALSGLEFRVGAKTTNAVATVEEMPSAPSNGDTFAILRQRTPVVDSSGSLSISVAASGGRAYVGSARYDHSTPVTTAAWTQVIASTADDIEEIFVWDSSGEILELGVGGAGSEARVFLIPRGGINGPIDLHIPAGSRLAVRAVSANTAAGDLVLTGLGA
jgi:hypothetical protein